MTDPTSTAPSELQHDEDFEQAFSRIPDANLGKGHISFKNRLMQNTLMAVDTFMSRAMAAKHIAARREKVQARVQADLAKRTDAKVVDVPRRRNLGPEEFYHEYLRKGVPVVLDGMCKEWACTKKWTMDYFADRYGDDKIVTTTGEIQTSDGSVKTHMTLREVIENKNPEQEKYLRFHPLIAEHPELADDIPFDWFEKYKGRWSMYSQSQFFIGAKGTTTGTHNSQLANLFALVEGEKEWYLYPTSYTPYIDPPVTHSVYRLSRHNSGLIHDPAYSKLDAYRVHLKEGDVLWNPPFYWHSVHNITSTIGVGYRWNDHFLSMKMHPMMWFLDIFATDPSWFSMIRMCRNENKKERSRQAARAKAGKG